MSTYENLRKEHHDLLKRLGEKPPQISTTDIDTFITRLSEGGRDVQPVEERTQLKDFIRFWTALLYEKDREQGYRRVKLEAYNGRLRKPFSFLKSGAVVTAFVVLGLLCFFLFFTIYTLSKFPRALGAMPPTLTFANFTAVAAQVGTNTPPPVMSFPTETPEIVVSTIAPSPTQTLSSTPTPETPEPLTPTAALQTQQAGMFATNTLAVASGGVVFPSTATPAAGDLPLILFPTATPDRTATSTLPPLAGIANLLSPKNGQQVSPNLEFAGDYNNLDQGWSIHVVLMPVSKSGLYFPLKDFYAVPQNQRNGSWSIMASLANPRGADTADTYIALLVLANSDELREMLTASSAEGVESLPAGALVLYNQPVTFYTKAGR